MEEYNRKSGKKSEIKITIRLLGPYVEMARSKEIELRFYKSINISQLLDHLENVWRETAKLPHLLTSDLHNRTYLVALNGNYIHFSERETTNLVDGDVISIIPAITGGCEFSFN